jgi:acetyl-CoA acetyltransferase
MEEWQAKVTWSVPAWKDKFAIVGIGETKYTRKAEASATGLTLEACKKAVEDAGLSPHDIDGYIEGIGGGASNEEFMVAFGLKRLGFYSRGQGGGTAVCYGVELAMAALDAGLINYAMVVTGGKSSEARASSRETFSTLQTGQFANMLSNWYSPFGMDAPGPWYSLSCRRYMHEYGLKSRHLGALASAMRSHAMLNETASIRTPLSIEDHQNSPVLVDPFHRWDFSLTSDGAGAFIVTTAERAKALKHNPVYIMGIGVAHSQQPNQLFTATELPWGHKWAAPSAYKMAGVTPKDIDFAEIYDGLTYIALLQIPALGFAKPEDAGPFCEPSETNIQPGGKLPINTHGGLCSHAHMIGINHFCEAVRQLRGQAGAAQVKKNGKLAEIGIVTGAGDMGDGAVTILRR